MSAGTDRIDRIVIVGGGTAGWMSAVALGFAHRAGPCTVRVVESDDIGAIGVGEATLPILRNFNRLFGIDEEAFMRATQASFKSGIQFVDWARPGHTFFHPFGAYGSPIERLRFYHFWLRARRLGAPHSLNAYCENAVAAEQDRFARARWPSGDIVEHQYAFHFDATLYGTFLRRRALALGVTRTEGRIAQVRLRETDGFIDSLELASGEVIEADLFVDCSGFRALLIEGALKIGYQDWTHWLPADRAMAVPCESTESLTPYTRSTTRQAGWQWRIPLQHRTGNGYVYSSAYTDDDEAAATLLAHLDGRPLAEPRPLRFVTGRRNQFWHRNCVAIGLSSGFLEPLESSSIALMQNAIFRMLELMPDRHCDPATLAEYNRQTIAETERTRDFIILHYLGNGRPGALWSYCRNMTPPDSLAERIALFRVRGHLNLTQEPYGETSWLIMLTELGFAPADYNPMADAIAWQQTEAHMATMRSDIEAYVRGLPTHRAYLEANCRAEPPLPWLPSTQAAD